MSRSATHSARHKLKGLVSLTRTTSRARAVLLALMVFILPIAIQAQMVSRTPRLCFVTFDRADRDERFKPFFDGLRELGYADGQTITIDYLPADGAAERFPALATECLHRQADIIVVTTTPAAQAAKKVTDRVPIVTTPSAIRSRLVLSRVLLGLGAISPGCRRSMETLV